MKFGISKYLISIIYLTFCLLFRAGYSTSENDESCSPITSTADFSTIQELKDRIDRLSQEKDLLVQKNAEKENEIFECSMKIEELEHKLILHAETVANENQQRIQIDELTTSLNELQYAFSKEKDDNRHKVEELESDLGSFCFAGFNDVLGQT